MYYKGIFNGPAGIKPIPEESKIKVCYDPRNATEIIVEGDGKNDFVTVFKRLMYVGLGFAALRAFVLLTELLL